ncbi:hypothetical protein C8R43DRAFT_957031 [Mycena crocata]|nr:hypothetical protein C8R43DRAFT_957031 [Mycena crocata]
MPRMLSVFGDLSQLSMRSSDPLPNGQIKETYLTSDSPECLVIGMVRDIIWLTDGEKLLVLCPPTGQSAFIGMLYQHQLNVLSRLESALPPLVTRLIAMVEPWTQPVDSLIFVRYMPEASIDLNHVSSAELESLGIDVPEYEVGRAVLQEGALVLCHIEVNRVDTPFRATSSSNWSIYSRAFSLRASRIGRFYREPIEPGMLGDNVAV